MHLAELQEQSWGETPETWGVEWDSPQEFNLCTLSCAISAWACGSSSFGCKAARRCHHCSMEVSQVDQRCMLHIKSWYSRGSEQVLLSNQLGHHFLYTKNLPAELPGYGRQTVRHPKLAAFLSILGPASMHAHAGLPVTHSFMPVAIETTLGAIGPHLYWGSWVGGCDGK